MAPLPAGAEKGQAKTARIPVKIEPTKEFLRKPAWIRVKAPVTPEVVRLKKVLRQQSLHTVCEEANCPNLGECFSEGTATFMILGNVCTRRCPFCDVAHGRPDPVDINEPQSLARTIASMKLRHVVITSVDRDDLRDGGSGHYVDCIEAIRDKSPETRVEVLVPDFRGRMEIALDILSKSPPDIMNHNLETVPRLYRQVRPGADYAWSLKLLKEFRLAHPSVPTKSGLMLGVGETFDEVVEVMRDLRAHGCDMLTIGQYLQPSRYHLPVSRYVDPKEFEQYRMLGEEMGFYSVASGPLVRSSYHADLQADGVRSRGKRKG
ncbi:MAG TPA: lipoyl synthase [Gammaproteobacteria bacterium]|nr:lipoyl synthase [Gammaproteobacteria bacterium]